MDERFEPIVGTLRRRASPAPPSATDDRTPAGGGPATVSSACSAPSAPNHESRAVATVESLRNLALLRVAAAEACESACRHAVRALADEVLGRELQLAPVDLDRLIRRALDELSAAEPIALFVSPAQAALDCGLPTRMDAALGEGDAVLEVRDGSVDLRLRVRLEDALE